MFGAIPLRLSNMESKFLSSKNTIAVGMVSLIEMGVSKNNGTPKWMVYNGQPYFLMDDLGVALFLETPK